MHCWGLSRYSPSARHGIAECEHALALDRNLAGAHFLIGLAKVFIGRAEETEAHIAEALRLSPRDTIAYLWMTTAGSSTSRLSRLYDLPCSRRFRAGTRRVSPVAQHVLATVLSLPPRRSEGAASVCEAPPRQLRASGHLVSRRAIEANRNNPPAYLNLAAALAQLGRLDEARSAFKAGLALGPAYTVSRRRASWTAQSDEPTYLAQLEPIFEGLRKAGVPEQ